MRPIFYLCTIAILGLMACGAGFAATTPEFASPKTDTPMAPSPTTAEGIQLVVIEDLERLPNYDRGDWRQWAYWCQYATDWVMIKSNWQLSVSRAEWAALDEMLATCTARLAVELIRQRLLPIPL